MAKKKDGGKAAKADAKPKGVAAELKALSEELGKLTGNQQSDIRKRVRDFFPHLIVKWDGTEDGMRQLFLESIRAALSYYKVLGEVDLLIQGYHDDWK